MKTTWLVFDVSNIAWRAYHTTKGLSYEGKSTGVTFGVFKAIQSLMDMHATRHVAFCFDHGESKRKKMYKRYKYERHNRELTDEERTAMFDVKNQLEKIKKDYLPRVGFKNVFYSKGYEGDDVIASVIDNLKKDQDAIIVSTDKDLWQLLSSKCIIWNPIKQIPITRESFKEEWGLAPRVWANIKAMAGCKTDGIDGIKGIGEKTAAAYFRGDTKRDSHAWQTIMENMSIFHRNMHLVNLPLDGCPHFHLEEDEVKPKAWRLLTEKLGMNTLMRRPPGMVSGFGILPTKLKKE